tara:strand:+ start:141 stop:3221 length:3081 start_codon:yes stop_codon:yes gene_type:complete
MSYSISSLDPIELLNPNRKWKIGHKGQLKELDISGILNISGDLHYTNKITGYDLDLYGDVSLNENLNVAGNAIFERAVYQKIDPSIDYDYYNGTYGLAKHLQPKQDDQTSKNLIINTNDNNIQLNAANTIDIANSVELRRVMVIGLNGYYASSSDGIYWDISGNISTNKLKHIIWVKEQEKFVIIGDNGFIATSTDSSNINITSNIISVNTLNSIAWSPELQIYLILGKTNNNTTFTATSDDAITWSNNTEFNDIQHLSSVIWVAELKRFICVGSYIPNNEINYYGFYMSTPNGINWDISGHITSALNCEFNSIAWSPQLSRITAVGENGFYATAMAEKDTITWYNSGIISDVDLYNKIIWIPQLQRFVAVGKKNTQGIMISSLNGINWDLSSNVPRICQSICWAQDLGKLYIPDTNGRIYYTNPKYVFQTTHNLFQDAMLHDIAINGYAQFNNKVEIQKEFIVHGDVSVNSNFNLTNNMVVYGDVSFIKSLDITDQLQVYGDSLFNVNVDISKNLYVNGDSLFRLNLDVSNKLTSKSLNILDDTSLNGNIDITGTTTIRSNDNTTALHVMTDACFNKNIILGGDGIDGYIYGPPNFHLYPVVNGSPDLSGRVIIRGDLVVLGSKHIVNTNTIDVSDSIITMNANNSVIRYGGIQVKDSNENTRSILYDNIIDKWDISDNIIFNGDAEFTQDSINFKKVNIYDKFEIFNDSTFNYNVDIFNDLNVDKNITLNSNGPTFFVDICGSLTVGNDTKCQKLFATQIDIDDKFIFHGDGSFNSNVDICGHLIVNGNVSLNNKLDVSGYIQAGTSKIGSSINNGNETALFGHKDMLDISNCAVAQRGGAETIINCKLGQSIRFKINDVEKMRLTADGSFGIGTNDPTEKLTVLGNVIANGYLNISDDRIKFDKKNIENGLDIIKNLTPKLYNKSESIDSSLNIKKEAGFIAQEVLLINDLSFVIKGVGENMTDKLYSLDYGSIFAFNVAATKELDNLVTSLSNEVYLLKQEKDIIKGALNKLLEDGGHNKIL